MAFFKTPAKKTEEKQGAQPAPQKVPGESMIDRALLQLRELREYNKAKCGNLDDLKGVFATDKIEEKHKDMVADEDKWVNANFGWVKENHPEDYEKLIELKETGDEKYNKALHYLYIDMIKAGVAPGATAEVNFARELFGSEDPLVSKNFAEALKELNLIGPRGLDMQKFNEGFGKILSEMPRDELLNERLLRSSYVVLNDGIDSLYNIRDYVKHKSTITVIWSPDENTSVTQGEMRAIESAHLKERQVKELFGEARLVIAQSGKAQMPISELHAALETKCMASYADYLGTKAKSLGLEIQKYTDKTDMPHHVRNLELKLEEQAEYEKDSAKEYDLARHLKDIFKPLGDQAKASGRPNEVTIAVIDAVEEGLKPETGIPAGKNLFVRDYTLSVLPSYAQKNAFTLVAYNASDPNIMLRGRLGGFSPVAFSARCIVNKDMLVVLDINIAQSVMVEGAAGLPLAESALGAINKFAESTNFNHVAVLPLDKETAHIVGEVSPFDPALARAMQHVEYKMADMEKMGYPVVLGTGLKDTIKIRNAYYRKVIRSIRYIS